MTDVRMGMLMAVAMVLLLTVAEMWSTHTHEECIRNLANSGRPVADIQALCRK